MESITLTNQQARRFLLAHQGLWPPYELEGKSGVLDHIRRVGCIQFDPLNIVGRNPELVLQARVSDYKPEMLGELLYQDRVLLDGWDKMMSIYPVDDWPFFQRIRDSLLDIHGDDSRPATSILPQVRKELEERGPLSSIDLDFNQQVDWSWSPTRIARAALESMYSWGELIVHHKVNTRKVYDFTHKHLPGELLEAEYHDWRVHRRIGGVGLLWGKSGDVWLSMSGIKSVERKAALTRLLEQGRLTEVHVEGLNHPLYMRYEDRELLHLTQDSADSSPRAAILAPLDNLLWDRRFAKEIFDFYYVWEVYKPVAERLYGYYVLPILYGDRFIARFEPGQDKKNRVLIIKNWWWEDGVRPSDRMRSELARCFKRFLTFLDADRIQMEGNAQEQASLDWLDPASN
jgi:uncharacterized protein YcaQ